MRYSKRWYRDAASLREKVGAEKAQSMACVAAEAPAVSPILQQSLEAYREARPYRMRNCACLDSSLSKCSASMALSEVAERLPLLACCARRPVINIIKLHSNDREYIVMAALLTVVMTHKLTLLCGSNLYSSMETKARRRRGACLSKHLAMRRRLAQVVVFAYRADLVVFTEASSPGSLSA